MTGSGLALCGAAILAAVSGCAALPQNDPSMAGKLVGPPLARSTGGPGLDEILRSPPSFTWEESRLEAKKQYLYVPGIGSDASCFFSPTSFQYHEPDNRLLKYEKFDGGFTILEVRKRRGIAFTPECPVILPAVSCTEEHFLMIAYLVDCRSSCTYRATVFDSFTPIRILPHDPALVQIMRHMMNRTNVLRDERIQITYEEYGVLDEQARSWQSYVEDRMAFLFQRVAMTEKVSIR